ncbi:MAG: hypothetical protein ACI4XM_01935 [Candidatus Coprovivens sp.]
MSKVLYKILFFFLLLLFFPNAIVIADDITINKVILYMEDNNLFEDKEYFQLFGRILNGDNEYDIDKFEYTIYKEDEQITFYVKLNDKNNGIIEQETTMTVTDNQITYINTNDIKSLESRVDTILFIQIIYSIGGARGYNKLCLVNWMNQIDLDNLTIESGIVGETEKLKYSYQVDNSTFDYYINIPKQYTIDINKITDNIPVSNYIVIKEVKKEVTSITLSVYAEEHLDEQCEIYRLNNNEVYEKVGTTSCNNGEFTDNNLKENTTYTYQATIKDKITCSDTKKITTEKVPSTGSNIALYCLGFLTILSTILYTLYKKFNLFRKV